MMLLNPSLNLTMDNIPRHLACASRDRQAVPRPVLDEPNHFFFMVASVTRLARLSRDLDQDERQMWIHLRNDIQQFECTGDTDDPIKRLYSHTLQILLLKVDPTQNVIQRTSDIEVLFREGLALLETVDLQNYLLTYSLWPVAVLGAIAVAESEQHTIISKIDAWARLRRGQAVRLQERLMDIWTSARKTTDIPVLKRLQLLMGCS